MCSSPSSGARQGLIVHMINILTQSCPFGPRKLDCALKPTVTSQEREEKTLEKIRGTGSA